MRMFHGLPAWSLAGFALRLLLLVALVMYRMLFRGSAPIARAVRWEHNGLLLIALANTATELDQFVDYWPGDLRRVALDHMALVYGPALLALLYGIAILLRHRRAAAPVAP